MICPACDSLMIVVEYKQIELDYCPECHGVWFDKGELELLLEKRNLADADEGNLAFSNEPEAPSNEKKRRCPICRRKMKKVLATKEPKILIDVCIRGDGLWFDNGELKQLIEQFTQGTHELSKAEEPVISFLKDVFRSDNQAN